MLVDPNTGMPMEDQPQRKSIVGTAMRTENKGVGAASAFAQDAGLAPSGGVTDALTSAIPGSLKGMAWNTYRSSRTIAYGGVNGKAAVSSFNATFNPKYMGRLSSMKGLGGPDVKSAQRYFKGSKYAAGESYTPFNALYKMGNSAVGGKAGIGTLARKGLVAKAREEGSMTAARNLANESKLGRFQLRMADYSREGPAFGMGSLARITAADKMARGKLPTGNIMNFLGETDKGLAGAYRTLQRTAMAPQIRAQQLSQTVSAAMPQIKMSPFGAQQAINNAMPTSMPISAVTATGDDATRLAYASVNGSISGRASGFMAQMRLGTAGAGGQDAAEMAGKKAFVAGTKSAAKFMEGAGIERVAATATSKGFFKASTAIGPGVLEKYGIKAGEKVAMKTAGKIAAKGGIKLGAKIGAAVAVNAIPIAGQIVSAVMLADLAMDVGKLGVEVFKSGVDFAKEAAISYKGSINKGVMGMGYRDSTVAATSRARGVQAIQNSRLNARSVLGSEAGAMAAHFG